eukprot:GILJ01009508.1.p1 GENE.GILJ01009508.1~~GILJ01009508.1.p1  ORF type:complete len:179 (-),score=16.07 GILJ01009508.1:153-689(-)
MIPLYVLLCCVVVFGLLFTFIRQWRSETQHAQLHRKESEDAAEDTPLQDLSDWRPSDSIQRLKSSFVAADPAEVMERKRVEDELKRTCLNAFRRLGMSETNEERLGALQAISKLFEELESRSGSRAQYLSGSVVYCNAIVDCDGLDLLRECRDHVSDPSSALIAEQILERIVPLIWSQ